MGLDRCGNIDVYAAPSVVHRTVNWPQGGWPVPWQGGWLYGPPSGSVWGSGSGDALACLMTGGAAMANWLIANQPPAPAPIQTPMQARARRA